MTEKLIYKYHDMEELLGKSRSSLWRMTKAGLLPKPIYVGNRMLGWRKSTILEWLDSVEEAA